MPTNRVINVWSRSLSDVVGVFTLMIVVPNFVAAQTAPTTAPKTPTGYVMATQPRAWHFPQDHGRHDGFKTEWWYFSGNLADAAGRAFGFQLTFFRVSVSPLNVPPTSSLYLGDIHFAHAAVSDLSGQRFYFKDIIQPKPTSQPAAEQDRLAVALDDWSATMLPTANEKSGDIVLSASDPSLAIHLTCQPGVGPVLEGPGGVSRKGEQPDQASYYYSLIRMPTAGTLTAGGKTFTVTGQTWMDHEFSSNALGPDQVGWDWVGLSLKDGRSLMIYRLRNKNIDASFLSGTLIDAAGHPTYLDEHQFTFVGSDPWKSPSGGAYPQTWSLRVAGLPPMTVRSRMPGQELRTDHTTKIDYFEGSCGVFGPAGEPLGDGYLEMTGYVKPMNPFKARVLGIGY